MEGLRQRQSKIRDCLLIEVLAGIGGTAIEIRDRYIRRALVSRADHRGATGDLDVEIAADAFCSILGFGIRPGRRCRQHHGQSD